MAGADASASFAMDLGITGAEDAKHGADALALFQEKVNGASEELAGMQKALRLLRGDSKGNAASIEDLKKKISAQRAVVASGADAYLKLGGSFRKAKPDTDKAGKALGLLKQELSGASPFVGKLVGMFGKLSGAVGGGTMAAGIIGVTVGLVALAAAAIGATVALAAFGLSARDARRSEELQLEGLTKLRFGYNLLGGGYQMAADKASFLQTTIDQVSSRVSIGREQVAGYTTQLYKMGLRAGNLKAALEGISIAASAQGEAGAQQFLYMASTMRFAGGSMQKLADDTKARLGGIVARQMLSLDVQTKKLKENFNFLFSGVRIEGFLSGLNKVTELFSANTESGKALKEILTTIFSPFFDTAGDAGDSFAAFIKGAELAALNFLISVYPIRKWLQDTFGDTNLFGDIGTLNTLITLGEVAFWGLGAALAVAAAAFVVFISPILLVGAAIFGLYQLVKDIQWFDLGVNIVKGIAQGITGGARWVFDAISNLGNAAVDKFKSVFNMHSPSRLMREEGINIPRGAAQGIDDGIPEITRAVGRSREAAEEFAPKPAAEAPARAGSSGGVAAGGVTIGNLVLQSNATDQKAIVDDFLAQLVQKLQDAALLMGAGKVTT